MKTAIYLIACATAVLLAGCGDHNQESQTPETVTSQVRTQKPEPIYIPADTNRLKHIFQNEELVQITDLGHLNEIEIRTKTNVYRLKDGGKSLPVVKSIAKQHHETLPLLHAD